MQRLQDLVCQLQAQLRGQRPDPDPDAPCVPTVKRPHRPGQVRVSVHAMPCTISAELSAWLEERHADLHDALTNGEHERILELTSKLSEGAGDNSVNVSIRWMTLVMLAGYR